MYLITSEENRIHEDKTELINSIENNANKKILCQP
jgi:hypothetical protein